MTAKPLDAIEQRIIRNEAERFIEWSGAVGEALENFKEAFKRLDSEDGIQWNEIRELHRIFRECRERCSVLSDCKASKLIVTQLDEELSVLKEQMHTEIKHLEEKIEKGCEKSQRTHDASLDKLQAKYDANLKELVSEQTNLKVSRAKIFTRLAFYGAIGGILASFAISYIKHFLGI